MHEGESHGSGHLTGTLTLICRDGEGKELARLSDVPGQFIGGRKELWFEGGLVNSSLTLKLGPIAPGMGGSVQMNLNLHRWDGQPLTQLAYFDRLNEFFQALPKSVSTAIECQRDGNTIFSVAIPLQSQPFAVPLSRYFETLSKARKVAHRFNVNPAWTVKGCDLDTLENVEQLYAIFFGNGWSQPMPNVRLTASCIRKTFRFDMAKQAEKPVFVRLISDCSYMFFGEKIEVGRLVQDYTEMSVKLVRKTTPAAKGRSKRKRGNKGRGNKQSHKDTVEIVLVGSKATVMMTRLEERVSSEDQAGQSVLSPRSKVTQQ